MTKKQPTLAEITELARRKAIEERLKSLDGSRKQTAESLDISPQQLQLLMKKYEIQVPPPLRYRRKTE